MILFNIGDVINFVGNQHFTASDVGATAKSCASGLAKIDMLAKDAAHPIHCIAEPYNTASVYGWVNLNDVKQLTYADALDKLVYYQVINSPDYWKDIISRNVVPHLDTLVLKSAALINKKLYNADDAYEGIENLLTAEVINSPDYWREMSARYSNVAALLKALGSSVVKKIETTNNSSQELRNKVVTTAQSFLGYNEWDGSHRQIIDIYNQQKPLPVGYRLSEYDSWCQCFVTVVFIQAGLKHLIYPECSCQRAINGYIDTGIGTWVEDDSYIPSSGDIIYYNWDDGWNYEHSDLTAFADHVGIVVSCDGYEILVIEGNYQDQVQYRTIKVNGRFIRGFFIPNYNVK